MPADLRDATLWLTTVRAVDGGRACRDLTVYDSAGTALLTARAFPWDRDIVVRSASGSDGAFLTLRRRVSFPLTGKVDAIDALTGGRIGVLNRSGRVRDANGSILGRFVDARTLRRRAAMGLVEAVGTALVGGDGSATAASSPAGFTYTDGRQVIGALSRAPLPFDTRAAAAPTRLASLVRLLPMRVRDALAQRLKPKGWRFERATIPPHEDPRLAVAAAILTVELSHW
jgi:hypothetical protein